jgi:holo-[acyl-carrier protein] synthase
MKIIGIGIDIVDVGQFEKISFKSKSGFYKKLFTKSEIKYCLRYKNYSERFAAKFAVKEAVKKSIPDKIQMLEIETYHLKSKPQVRLKELEKKYTFHVSLSHEKGLAVAIVIAERNLSA